MVAVKSNGWWRPKATKSAHKITKMAGRIEKLEAKIKQMEEEVIAKTKAEVKAEKKKVATQTTTTTRPEPPAQKATKKRARPTKDAACLYHWTMIDSFCERVREDDAADLDERARATKTAVDMIGDYMRLMENGDVAEPRKRGRPAGTGGRKKLVAKKAQELDETAPSAEVTAHEEEVEESSSDDDSSDDEDEPYIKQYGVKPAKEEHVGPAAAYAATLAS